MSFKKFILRYAEKKLKEAWKKRWLLTFSYMYKKICFPVHKKIKSTIYKKKIFNKNIILMLIIFI